MTSELDKTADISSVPDSWDASTDVAPVTLEQSAVTTKNEAGLMFNNFTKTEEDERTEVDTKKKKKKHGKKPSSSQGKRARGSRETTKTSSSNDVRKRPQKRKRNGKKSNKGNSTSQPSLLSVDDMFKLGFGKTPQGHFQAHRGHTPRDSSSSNNQMAASGPAGRLFQLTGRAPTETIVDTMLDFSIPDVRSRPRTVSPRTRLAREEIWKKMQDEHNAVVRASSRGGGGTRGSRRASSRGSVLDGGLGDGVGADGVGGVEEEDPAMILLREKQEKEQRVEQEMLAQSMGLSVEEMVALDAAASEGTEDAIQEYMEAFHRIDKDGSGSLSPDELREVMHELGEDMNEKELEEMIAEADHDGDGEIDYDEFTGMMRARKRRELLARNMTQAQASHRKAGHAHRRPSADQQSTIIPTLDDGTGLETVTSVFFEEFQQKYPNSGAPPLPPLQLSRATMAKRHMRDVPASKQFLDRFLTRPTPHVLKTGASANADVLRIHLTKSQDIIHQLDAKVQEGIEWVQAHCPVTNIKAQMYCQKWGLEKLTALFNKIAYRQMIAALEKWNEFVDYQVNQDKAENYMKWKGTRRLVKMLEDFDLKQTAAGWDKWVHVIAEERSQEENIAATHIERLARGFLGRRRVLNICTGRAAIEIQRVGRGMIGRKKFQVIYWEYKREWAAQVIQHRYRGYQGRQLGRIIMQKKREHNAACVLQRAWRGFSGRRITRIIAHKKLEIKSAIYIQNCWRTRVSRRIMYAMRLAIAEEESALYIQTWWRSVLGYREGQARLLAHRYQVRRDQAAQKIQNGWRGYVARKKVENKRLTRATIRVQMAWRRKKGRYALQLKKAAKAQIEREEAEAKDIADKLAREMDAKRKLKEAKEQAHAACAIQGKFRQKMAKKNLSERRKQAVEKRKNSEERALRNRAALRIQCAWRGKQGQLSAHLRKQAQKFRAEEEARAAMAIQSRLRGRATRKQIQEAEEKKRKDAERKLQEAAAARAQSSEEERSASKMQALFRGKADRSKVESMRAAKAMEEQEKFEMELSATKMQSTFRAKLARKKVAGKKMALLEHARKMEEAEQAHAALLIQQRIRARSAKNELEKRKEQHELELAAETDMDARKRLRERQEQEIAAVRLQQLFRSRHARKEVAQRKMKLSAEKRRLKEERAKQLEDLAALKIQGMVRKWQAKRMLKTKLNERKKEMEKKKQEEEDALEQEHAALILQKRMRGLHAKKEVAEKRAAVEAEKAALEEEEQDLKDKEVGATKLQAMFRARKAKQSVDDRRAQHDAEMVEAKKRNAKESELAELREKQEMELAAMKLQAIYRGRKLRLGFDDVKSKRLVEINKRKKKLHGELSAIKIQGMFRSFKARKELHRRMDAVKNRRAVSDDIV